MAPLQGCSLRSQSTAPLPSGLVQVSSIPFFILHSSFCLSPFSLQPKPLARPPTGSSRWSKSSDEEGGPFEVCYYCFFPRSSTLDLRPSTQFSVSSLIIDGTCRPASCATPRIPLTRDLPRPTPRAWFRFPLFHFSFFILPFSHFHPSYFILHHSSPPPFSLHSFREVAIFDHSTGLWSGFFVPTALTPCRTPFL